MPAVSDDDSIFGTPAPEPRGARAAWTDPGRYMLLLASALLVLIVATVAWEGQRIEQDRMRQFEDELRHQAELMDETLSRELQGLDTALLMLRAVFIDHRDDMARAIAQLRQGSLKDLNVYVTVADREGRVAFTDVPGETGEGVNLGDREHFRIFAAGGVDRLYISDPVFGRLTKRWGVQLARPVIGRSGEFQGVILVFLPPEQLTRFVAPLAQSDATVMSVHSRRGALLSRSSGSEIDREQARLSDEQMNAYRQVRQGYQLQTLAAPRGEQALAFRWNDDYPLLLIVTRRTDAARAGIRELQARLLLVGGGAAVLVLLALGGLGLVLRQRQHVERKLRWAHAHLLEAQSLARLGSWDWELGSGRLRWSDQSFGIFGLGPGEVPDSYEAALAMVHPEDRDEADRHYRSALQTRQPFDFTHRLLGRDGQITWVHARGSVVCGPDGKLQRVAGTVQDITERKREEAERESLMRDRLLLLESTGEGIYGLDSRGLCTFANQAGARLLGYEPAELVGRELHELIHSRHSDGKAYPLADCPVHQASLSGRPARVSNEVFWHRDGHPIPVEYAAYPIVDEGQVSGTVVIFSDITQRKHAEQELRIADKAFQTQEGMFVTDAEGSILRVNSAFTEITGFSAADAVGQNPRFRSSGRQDAAFYAAMWERIRATGAWKGELWNRRKNGEVYPESVTITAVQGDDGRVSHYVATLHDITERKATEARIHDMAFIDALTHLPNRRLLMDRLGQAQAGSARSRTHAGLMFIDLDKFKALNDTHGHDAGDLLLQRVAIRLLECVRETDTVARLGGDEFVVLLDSLSADRLQALEQTHRIGEKIMASLNAPHDLDGLHYQCTPSIGATVFLGHEHTGEALLKQADLAMYQSKASGRNRLKFFDSTGLLDPQL